MTLRSDRPRRLVLYGFYVNRAGDTYRWKHAHARYASDLAPYFDEIVLCPQVFTERDAEEGVQTPPQRVEVTGVTVLPASPFGSHHGLWADHRALRTLARDGDSAWLMILPNSMAPPLVLAHPPRFAFSYFGSDWADAFLAQGKTGPAAALRSRYYRWGQNVCARASVGLIVAGKALAQAWRGRGRPVHETRPIVALRPRHIESRTVTMRADARLLYVGHLGWGKGLAELWDAFATLRRDHPDLRLRLVGQGPAEAELRRRAQGDPSIEITGYVSKFEALREIYRDADLLVLPSRYEGFSRILYEAWAHGLPVVSTSVGGIPLLVRDGEHAVLVPPGDAHALAAGIQRLVRDQGLASRLALGGRELVRDILSQSAGEQHAEIITEAWAVTHGGSGVVRERVVGPTTHPGGC